MYQIQITDSLAKAIKKTGHPGIRKKIQNLLKNPKAYGKPLKDNLQGFWTARADPYRIIYEIDEAQKLLILISVDTRDVVYE
jgi:mRNA interferase RelE/StbE